MQVSSAVSERVSHPQFWNSVTAVHDCKQPSRTCS